MFMDLSTVSKHLEPPLKANLLEAENEDVSEACKMCLRSFSLLSLLLL